jgi:hypothetical protein
VQSLAVSNQYRASVQIAGSAYSRICVAFQRTHFEGTIADMPETDTQLIERAFQELINTKHLYQSIEIDFEPAIIVEAGLIFARRNIAPVMSLGSSGARPHTPPSMESIKRELIAELEAKDWLFVGDAAERGRLSFSLLPVKTLCSVCDDVTSFNLWADTSGRAQTITIGNEKQVFCLPLHCQGCRSNVIVFLIARNGRKIQLVGRSEFEQVKVPPSIPKEHKGFYSQAVIAFNCGQILPALFLLRTLIEQHMRTVTGRAELRGDELCDEYNKTLDADFKSRFPSFKDVYGKLSDALHRADPDKFLFESERERIVNHFDALNVFAKAKKLNPTNDQPKAK